jgi:hypothetical protein
MRSSCPEKMANAAKCPSMDMRLSTVTRMGPLQEIPVRHLVLTPPNTSLPDRKHHAQRMSKEAVTSWMKRIQGRVRVADARASMRPRMTRKAIIITEAPAYMNPDTYSSASTPTASNTGGNVSVVDMTLRREIQKDGSPGAARLFMIRVERCGLRRLGRPHKRAHD